MFQKLTDINCGHIYKQNFFNFSLVDLDVTVSHTHANQIQ